MEPYSNWEAPAAGPLSMYAGGAGPSPDQHGVKSFWSPEVQRRVAMSQPASSRKGQLNSHGGQREPARVSDGELERVIRDAEETFEREVLKLQAARTRDDASYRTEGFLRVQLYHLRMRRLVGMTIAPSPPPPPPAPHHLLRGVAEIHMLEALRNFGLPDLRPPGGEAASLHFGDWVTVIHPPMSDINGR